MASAQSSEPEVKIPIELICKENSENVQRDNYYSSEGLFSSKLAILQLTEPTFVRAENVLSEIIERQNAKREKNKEIYQRVSKPVGYGMSDDCQKRELSAEEINNRALENCVDACVTIVTKMPSDNWTSLGREEYRADLGESCHNRCLLAYNAYNQLFDGYRLAKKETLELLKKPVNSTKIEGNKSTTKKKK